SLSTRPRMYSVVLAVMSSGSVVVAAWRGQTVAAIFNPPEESLLCDADGHRQRNVGTHADVGDSHWDLLWITVANIDRLCKGYLTALSGATPKSVLSHTNRREIGALVLELVLLFCGLGHVL
ncbi:hypothetical protein, partial [Mycolicibacterium fallax]|uniref:hypothetical protein n=1 Tax=Mycolicibacterium fallax TaxID=1793 RepID=UPI0021F3ADF1